jgi:molecular chaperone DnaK (HSP70)
MPCLAAHNPLHKPGRTATDLLLRSQEAKKLAYKVVADEDGAAALQCENSSEEGPLYPEEVSAYVVRELLNLVTDGCGTDIERAVISVPAYFDEEQREATVCAGVHPSLPLAPARLLQPELKA